MQTSSRVYMQSRLRERMRGIAPSAVVVSESMMNRVVLVLGMHK